MVPSEIVRRGRESFDRGDSGTARSLAEHVLGVIRKHAGARLLRALIAESEGRLDEALDDLSLVVSAEPANPEARVVQGRIFKVKGDDARARAFARQTVELIPRSPAVLESALDIVGVDADALASSPAVLGRVHLSSGWPSLAERHARLGLEDGADRVDVRLTLAEALMATGPAGRMRRAVRSRLRSGQRLRAGGHHAGARAVGAGAHGTGPGSAGARG